MIAVHGRECQHAEKFYEMNILIINHYAGSPNHGMEFRPYYMAREWVKSNHRVKIVAASFSHIRSEQPRLDGKTLDETVNDIDYRWYATPPYRDRKSVV